MTGPAEGKIDLPAQVFLDSKKIDAVIYVHLKGYALARVTHLDIESESLNILPVKGGGFFTIRGIDSGIEIELKAHIVRVICSSLNEVLGVGKATRTWVGGKVDGIYVGFKKAEIEKLEKIAKR
jgi:hypothetical protein